MNTFEQADANSKEVYNQLNHIAQDICSNYSKEVDDLVKESYNVENLSNTQIRNLLAKLSVATYTLAEYSEKASLRSECSIALQKEQLANSYIYSEGTQALRNNTAQIESNAEIMVSILYKSISSLLKVKVDEAHRIANMLSGVLISRASEAKLAIQ